MENKKNNGKKNILILCMDQWQTHMNLPAGVIFPAMERLESQGVTFERQYCTVPICTPSRATMWTGVHAAKTGLWDNTNFAWINELSSEFPTIGHMLREQGYYTAFKGKWHLSEVPFSEDALERYGFSDFQQWGDVFGKPLEGAKVDGTVVFETIDWLKYKSPHLDQPWLLLCNLVNPHDIMYFQSDSAEEPIPNGAMSGKKTSAQRLSWFEKEWPVELPENFDDDLKYQPFGVKHYKEFVEKHYGKTPEEQPEPWLKRRNYLINAMRLVDYEFNRIIGTLDELDLWKDTIVVFTSDHGEMNGAHRMSQKGAIHFDEAAIVNLTVCVPDGPKGVRTSAVGSHLDLAPTLLEFAGLPEKEIKGRYPHLKGNSFKSVIMNPGLKGPRGKGQEPGKGALYCWDGLNMLDKEWSSSGVLQSMMDSTSSTYNDVQEQLQKAGEKFGAPDFNNRTFFRTVVDGQYKLVRWFSPNKYGNPGTLEELYAHSDVTLHDLINDPLEMENLAQREHPKYDPEKVERMLRKLHNLIIEEIGNDKAPFDLNLFGTQ